MPFLNINDLIAAQRLAMAEWTGARIRLLTDLDPKLGYIRADRDQIGRVLECLVKNARDSMPSGGELTIETANVNGNEISSLVHKKRIPGSFVMLAVRDTGRGVDLDAPACLLEPIYTAASSGQDRQACLSVVDTIVKQSGGHIAVLIEPGRGTTIKAYLPRFQKSQELADSSKAALVLPGGFETILLVEDELVVRSISSRVLRDCGYTVFAAGHSEEALDIVRRHRGPIHLLLTDVVMPKMGGRELADQLTRARPGTRVLYMSGYPSSEVMDRGILNPDDVPYLAKPFTLESLAYKVREVLDIPEN
ncbi:MAG: response regulator [Elusimicrobia bacterium]|nr:response regulator [Elusimicrobiota bacterium]